MDRNFLIEDLNEIGELEMNTAWGVSSLFEQYDDVSVDAANDDMYENLYAMPS